MSEKQAMRTGVAALLLIALASPFAASADVKAGVEAWQRGDYAAAIAQWLPAAEHGDADAQFNLGQAYKLGRGVPRDLKIAQGWYRKAALQGHWEAQTNYGLALFENGDVDEALPWLIGSAQRGESRALYVLGTLYFNGVHVRRDWVRAYALMARAAAAGLPQASTTLNDMDKYLAFSDRQQGLSLARDTAWKPPEDQPLSRQASKQPPPTDTDAVVAAKPTPAVQPVSTAPAPPSTDASKAPAPPSNPAGDWAIQLGAFGEPGNAPRLWQSVRSRFPDRNVRYAKTGKLTRVLVGPFATRAGAQAACEKTSPCFPVRWND